MMHQKTASAVLVFDSVFAVTELTVVELAETEQTAVSADLESAVEASAVESVALKLDVAWTFAALVVAEC